MSVIVEFSIFPVDKGEHLAPYVARAVKIIRDSGLPHELNPMGTSIEGEWDEVMAVIKQCFDDLISDSERVYAVMKVDYKKGQSGQLKAKVRAVEERL